MQIRMDIKNKEKVFRAMKAMPTAYMKQVALGLHREHEFLMTDAKRLTPVVTGNLRASGHVVSPVQRGTEIVSQGAFGGPAGAGNQNEANAEPVGYAFRVHENPRAGKTGGVSPSGKQYYPRPGLPVPYSRVGQWKFYETAAKNYAGRLAGNLAAFLQSRQSELPHARG